jgi:hypothetical protein
MLSHVPHRQFPLILLACAFLLQIACAPAGAAGSTGCAVYDGASTWSQDGFRIGAWTGPNFDYSDTSKIRQSIQLAQSAGFNLSITPTPGITFDRTKMLTVLSIAAGLNFNVIVTDGQFSALRLFPNSYAAYWGRWAYDRTSFLPRDSTLNMTKKDDCVGCGSQAYSSCIEGIFPFYVGTAGVYGYYIVDEPLDFPGSTQEEDLIKLRIGAIGYNDPSRLAFFNLHPTGINGDSTLTYAARMAT